MELIYLYIGKLNRCIDNQEIHFSNKFEVDYNNRTRNIKISKKNRGSASDNFYANNIVGLKVLVGRNGSGKSTILDLLGLPEPESVFTFARNQKGDKKIDISWFAVYHLESDFFAIEGHCPKLIRQLDSFEKNEGRDSVKNHYSIGCRVDFNMGAIRDENICFLQDLKTPSYPNSNANTEFGKYFYYHTYSPRHWFVNRNLSGVYSPSEPMITRVQLDESNYCRLWKYMWESLHNDDFKLLLNSNPSGLVMEINCQLIYTTSIGGEEGEEFCKKLYGICEPLAQDITEINNLELEYSNKQLFILHFLERIILKHLENANEQFPLGVLYCPGPDKNDRYSNRKKHLYRILEQLNGKTYLSGHVKQKIIDDEELMYHKKVCESLEYLDERYFTDYSQISISIKNVRSKTMRDHIGEIMKLYDVCCVEQFLEQEVIKIKYHNLSAGELEFINLYASLFSIFDVNHAYGDTCILLMDEPDSSFHPEWSRNFMKNLIDFLKTPGLSKYKFQIIMTTHSPIILSDVLKDDIICLDYDMKEEKTVIKKSKFGFMSNINEIMTDTFFVKGVVGTFAEEIVDQLICDINNLQKEIETIIRDDFRKQIVELDNKVELINEPFIKRQLQNKLLYIREQFANRLSDSDERKQKYKNLLKEIRKLENNDSSELP